jgi:flagellar motor switch protein FliM
MPASGELAKQIRPYDFHRHEAMDRSRLRRLVPVLEVAAHRATQSLAGIVRAPVHVEVGELEQMRWEAFANSLPEPTFVATATVAPLGGRIALHVPIALASAVVELRLGGSASKVVPERALSEIELRLFSEAAESFVTELFEALKVVEPMMVGPLNTTNSAVLVQMPNPSEIYLLVGFSVSIGDGVGSQLTVCLPLSILLALLDALERVEEGQLNEPDSVVTQVRERLLDAPVDLSVSFPEIVLSTDELLSLNVGDVISLQRPEGLPLRLNLGGVHYCDVVPTTKGRRLACMVTESRTRE